MNTGNEKLSNSLGKTLVKSDLSEITINVLETIVENEIIENDLIRSIPIFNSILGIGKTFNSISDILFTQKLVSFLTQLSDIDSEQREKMISKIDLDKKYKQKVGSKIIHIIDNSQDYLLSHKIGKLFASFVKGQLSYPEFCRASLILNRIDYHDLEEFLNIPDKAYGENGTKNLGLEEVDNFLIIAGLCSAETSRAEIAESIFNKEGVEIIGGETKIYRTLIGEKIYKVLTSSEQYGYNKTSTTI